MASEPRTDDEVEALRRQLAEQERGHAERIRSAPTRLWRPRRTSSYWLERWQVDLNELMRRPGASEARAAVRALRMRLPTPLHLALPSA